MAVKVAVILSGSGYKDGAEIHEAVIALLALDRAGAEITCLAPNIEQPKVVNHLTGEEMKGERRNILVEAARIGHGLGKILVQDIAKVDCNQFDAVVVPGGLGSAINLSDFLAAGPNAKPQPDVGNFLQQAYRAKKPIGSICISSAMMATVLGKEGISVAVGNDPKIRESVTALGARPQDCGPESIVIDRDHRLVSTPAYLIGPNIRHVAAGIELLVSEVLRMV